MILIMPKRQVRIYEPAQKSGKEELVGNTATLCMADKSVIFGTIIQFNGDLIIVKDKLRRKHSFPFKDVSEIILETEGIN